MTGFFVVILRRSVYFTTSVQVFLCSIAITNFYRLWRTLNSTCIGLSLSTVLMHLTTSCCVFYLGSSRFSCRRLCLFTSLRGCGWFWRGQRWGYLWDHRKDVLQQFDKAKWVKCDHEADWDDEGQDDCVLSLVRANHSNQLLCSRYGWSLNLRQITIGVPESICLSGQLGRGRGSYVHDLIRQVKCAVQTHRLLG